MTNDNNQPKPELELSDDEKLVLSPGVYDKLKLTAILILPTISTLYFTLGAIWGFPAIDKVIGTLAAAATAIGGLVQASSKRYKNSDARFDGVMKPIVDGGGVNGFSMDLKPSVGIEDLQDKSEVTFKVAPVHVP